MTKKSKRYVVREGRQTGVFATWTECQQSILHYPAAKYKAFPNKNIADQAWTLGYKQGKNLTISAQGAKVSNSEIITSSICVDAACSSNPGTLERQGVHTTSGKVLFHQGPYKQGTVNIGEFLALVQGLKYLVDHNLRYPIYSDSRTAIARVRKQKSNTTLTQTPNNAILFTYLTKAEKRLQANPPSRQIIKRNTKERGEIPADFGRK